MQSSALFVVNSFVHDSKVVPLASSATCELVFYELLAAQYATCHNIKMFLLDLCQAAAAFGDYMLDLHA